VNNRTYASPLAFKNGLEQRLRNLGSSLVRERQLLIFERYLARLIITFGGSIMLKGGLALELRLDKSQSTKDIDLRLQGSSVDLLERLQRAGRIDLQDFMTFEVRPDDDHPRIGNDGMKYEGFRFRAECALAGKLYGNPFGVDVAFGDPITGHIENLRGKDTLGFAGVLPPTIPAYPVETHIAEKLHAYTLVMPPGRTNTRVKDLPDLALLASAGALESAVLRAALKTTFAFRNTHALPSKFPTPPITWGAQYANLAREFDLPWPSIVSVTEAVRAFLDPILAGVLKSVWDPNLWQWRAHH